MIPEDFQKYIRSNEFKKLLAKYRQFLNSDDEDFFNADDLLDIAEYYHLKNNHDESLRAAQCCSTLYPENEKAQVFIARTYLMNGDIDRAQQVTSEISSDDLLDTVYLRAELMLCKDEAGNAENYLRKHYELLTDNDFNNCFSDDDDIDDSILYYPLDVAELFLDFMLCEYAEGWLSLIKDKEVLESADYLECKARLLTAQEKYADAIPVWNAFIDKQAYSIMAWVQLSQCYYHEGNCAEALQCAQYAEAIDNNTPETYLAAGNSLFSLGKIEESLSMFSKYLSLCPNDIQGELLMASTLYSIGKFDDARSHIDVSISQVEMLVSNGDDNCPDFLCVEVYRQAAYIYSSSGFFDEALRFIDNLLFYNIPIEQYHILRASILLEAKRLKEAFEILTELLKDSKHNPETYINVGCMLVDSNVYEAGFKLLSEVLSIIDGSGVNNGRGYDRLAFAALLTKRYDEFLDALELSVKHLPSETATIFCSFFPMEMPVCQYIEYARSNRHEIELKVESMTNSESDIKL